MPSDPIREALVTFIRTCDDDRDSGNFEKGSCATDYREGRVSAATEALTIYDQAKFALDDTTEAATVEIKRPRTPRRRK